MRYLSVCSGIEAATVAWHPLGWQPWAFSEIEKFPSAVLAHHYPTVPNLGDMTKFQEWPDATVDLLVGGTPCQSFSVAGLRQGLRDPRGNLTLTFLAVADKYRPRYVVWENVPGILSDSTSALDSFLEGLAEIGYAIIGFDVLDAQFFGLAQRRRRVFVCAQRVDDLLEKKTTFSALIAIQCLAEIWRHAFVVLDGRLNRAAANSDWQNTESGLSLKKRIALFGLHAEEQAWRLVNCLDAILPSSALGPSASDWESGKSLVRPATNTVGTKSPGLNDTPPGIEESPNTEMSWKSILVVALKAANECITSTASSETIESRIYTCAEALLITSGFMLRLNPSLPNYSHAAASCLTALKGYIAYARSTSTSLFGDTERVHRWVDFVGQAEHASAIIGNIGIANFGEVLPLVQGLSGHPAPRREVGQGVAGPIGGSAQSGGFRTTDLDNNGAYIPEIVPQAMSSKRSKGSSGPAGDEVANLIAHSLRAEGHDASEDGTGRGVPPLAFDAWQSDVIQYGDQSGPLDTDGHTIGVLCDTIGKKGISHASTQETHARTLLRTLREEVGAEAFTQWGLGILDSLLPAEVLRSALHGCGVRLAPFSRRWMVYHALARPEAHSEGIVQSMREAEREGRASQGWRPSEQLARELGAYLSELSQPGPSPQRFMRDLWEASEGLGLLRQALSAIQEVGRPSRVQAEPARSAMQVRRWEVYT